MPEKRAWVVEEIGRFRGWEIAGFAGNRSDFVDARVGGELGEFIVLRKRKLLHGSSLLSQGWN